MSTPKLQKKVSGKLQKKQSKKGSMNRETLQKVAEWLRNKGPLDAYSGVTRGRRIDFFRGDEFVDALCSKRCAKQNFIDIPITRSKAIEIGNAMLKFQYFHQSTQLNKPKKTDDDAIKIQPMTKGSIKMIDEDEAVYTWMLPASHTRVYIQSGLFLIAALFLCMFKVWPLVLKIFIWWCSLILLITMTTLFIIRLIAAALLWIIGFRGLWLLPNLFNEEIDTLDTFTPLIGYGIDSKKGRKEARRKEKEERARKEAERAAKKDTKGKKKDKDDKETKKEEDKPTETIVEGRFSDCNFGLINMLMIGILAIICCNALGLFMSENIPDFVVSQNELWKRFPGLAPPNASQPIINDTNTNNVPPPIVEEVEDDGVDMSKFVDEVDEDLLDNIIDDLDDIQDLDAEEEDDNKKNEL